MLTEETITKLNELRLYQMAEVFRKFQVDENSSALSFEERLGIMVDQEWSVRKSKKLSRLCKSAGYVFPHACIEDIRYDSKRRLDKTMIAKLSACTFIQKADNVIILGATGTGKSYLSCAIGIAANRNFYTVKYIRLPDLFSDLAVARTEGTYKQVIREFQSVRLLILDEWLLFPLTATEARDVLEIVEARYDRGSTVFCSQFQVEGWYEKIGEATFADAICDRVVHNAYTIVLEGESMRKILGVKK